MKNPPTPIAESVDEPEVPPSDLREIISYINADLNYSSNRGSLVPYLMNSRDDWRCYLLDADGNTLASALVISKLDRHNVSMMLYGFENQARVNIEKGKRAALDALHQHNKQILGLK